MHIRNDGIHRALLAALALLLLAALACNLSETATPTVPQVVELCPTPPQALASDTPAPDVPAPGGCTLNAEYVTDVTVPDDTPFPPGAAFTKTWRVRNSGTCEWEVGTQLVYVSGDPLGGPATVSVVSVAPGSTTDVSVNFTAPGTPGTYRSNWQMQSPDGVYYGSQIYVQIVVPAPPTDTPEPPTAPPPAPTALGGGTGRIAYVSLRDGNAEIYVMKGDDSAPARLTNNPAGDDWPAWSPDGTRIAFDRWVGGKPDILVMNADGSGQTNLTSDPAYDTGPAWSPDGTRIAFASNRAGGKLQIWVMNTDGSGLTQLTTDSLDLNSDPTWSPDGSRIALESTRDGQREIYVMNADGSAPMRLTHSGNNYSPDWSPDGTRIVFSSSDGIWSIRPDGTLLTQLRPSGMHPAWSPDSRQILFDSGTSGNFDIYVMNADGTNVRQLTVNPALDANSAWQP